MKLFVYSRWEIVGMLTVAVTATVMAAREGAIAAYLLIVGYAILAARWIEVRDLPADEPRAQIGADRNKGSR